MTNDVLRFEIGTLTEFIAPNGRRYLRGDIGGLRFTIAEEPNREPAAGGVARWSVVASPAPGKARHVMTPARQGAPVEIAPLMVKAPTKTARQEAAITAMLDRAGRIPEGGDEIGELVPATVPARDAELQMAIDLLNTPVI